MVEYTIHADTVLRIKPGCIFSRVDDELVVLSVENGEYIGLDPVGAEIWSRLETTLNFRSMVSDLCETFEVSEEQCTNDVTDFLVELLEMGLIEVVDE